MRFPNNDKLRRARNIVKKEGGDPEDLLEVADIYEKRLGGKVLGKNIYKKPKKKPKKSKRKPRKKSKKKPKTLRKKRTKKNS